MRHNQNDLISRLPFCIAVFLLILASGCSRADDKEERPFQIVLQTDWFPQPEHGGFYQALARGYYQEAGLDVQILPGGPNSMSTQKILKGSAQFAMNRADTVYSLAMREVPIVMVMATLQHDPQAILLHADNPIDRLEDLDGQRVMAIPGLTWIKWLEARYGISLEIIPHDFGLERFLQDPSFIQQCLLTNEPFYVRQAGVEPKVLPLRQSGFDPYHGIYCLETFARENPGQVAAFVKASIRGWQDFILNDPSPALELIAGLNPKMNDAFMAFSWRTMREENLVTGEEPAGRQVGRMDPQRLDAMVRELKQLGIVESDGAPPADWYTLRFLPKPGDEPGNELP